MKHVTAPKHGNNWQARKDGYIAGVFIINGKRSYRGIGRLADLEKSPTGKRRTVKQLNDAIQSLWETRREELERKTVRLHGEKRPIKDVLQEWMDGAGNDGLSPETVEKHYALMANQYLEGVGNHPLGEMSLVHVDRFKGHLAGKGLAPVTVNMRLGKLGVFLEWARKRGYIERPPMLEKVKEPKRAIRAPDMAQTLALLKRIHGLATTCPDLRQRYFYELHWMMLLFILGTGVRRGGPFYAKWENVSFEQGALLLPKSKGGEERLYLPSTVVVYLENRRGRYPDHVWLFDDGRGNLAYSDPHAMTTAFRRHQAVLGFARLKIKPLHGFRSLFATVNLNQLGADSKSVSALLGHASFSTTEKAYLGGMDLARKRVLNTYNDQVLSGLIAENLLKIESAKQ